MPALVAWSRICRLRTAGCFQQFKAARSQQLTRHAAETLTVINDQDPANHHASVTVAPTTWQWSQPHSGTRCRDIAQRCGAW
jgi:hypothetical protein